MAPNMFSPLRGAPQDPLIEMQNHEGVRVVLGRSERSALAMADAYARVTGKPTFGIVQFGPGATYPPASIIDAFWASSPLIAISGTTTTRTRYRYEYQELEQTSMFPSMTKWAGDLPQPERIADVFRTAVRASISGVPGPSYLGIPADWFSKKLTIAPEIYAERAFLRTSGRQSRAHGSGCGERHRPAGERPTARADRGWWSDTVRKHGRN